MNRDKKYRSFPIGEGDGGRGLMNRSTGSTRVRRNRRW